MERLTSGVRSYLSHGLCLSAWNGYIRIASPRFKRTPDHKEAMCQGSQLLWDIYSSALVQSTSGVNMVMLWQYNHIYGHCVTFFKPPLCTWYCALGIGYIILFRHPDRLRNLWVTVCPFQRHMQGEPHFWAGAHVNFPIAALEMWVKEPHSSMFL